jgi:hypothetical protein
MNHEPGSQALPSLVGIHLDGAIVEAVCVFPHHGVRIAQEALAELEDPHWIQGVSDADVGGEGHQ